MIAKHFLLLDLPRTSQLTKGDVRFPELAPHSPFQLKLCELTSSIGVTGFCLCFGILSFHASSDERFWMVTGPHPR